MAHIEHNHSEDTTELLSAYIDNALNITEQQRAERLINRCSGCAQEIQELRLLKQWLGAMPEVHPHRSFRIQPTVKEPRRLIFPVLRWATVAATVLLLLVVGVDVLRLNGAAREPMNGDLSMAAEAEPEAAGMDEAEEVPEAEEAPEAAQAPMQEPAPAADEAPPHDAEADAAQADEEALRVLPEEGVLEAERTPEATPQESPLLAEPEVGGAATTVDAAQDAMEQQEPFNTLRIAQIVLLVITIGLALAAAWTQYKHI